MHFVSKHTMRLHSGSRCICRNTSRPERVCVALPVTFLSPRVQLEFTVSPTSLNVCCGKESETGVCVSVCLHFSAWSLPKSHLYAHKVMTVGRETISVRVCVCVCSHVYLLLAEVCMRACVTDVHSLMTWSSVMLLPLSVCFIAHRDIIVSALFPAITPLKDVCCLTNHITFLSVLLLLLQQHPAVALSLPVHVLFHRRVDVRER